MDAPDIHVLSAGTVLPCLPAGQTTLAGKFHLSAAWEQWTGTFAGTRARHLAADLETGRARCSLTDLAETAAARALAAAGLEPGDVDVLIMSTATPEALRPSTVNLVAGRLGIDQVPAYQLQSGCSGAIQALGIARQMLRTGACQTVLVIAGDVCTKHLDLSMNLAELAADQLVKVVLFGDGDGEGDGAGVLSAVLSALWLHPDLRRRPGGGHHRGAATRPPHRVPARGAFMTSIGDFLQLVRDQQGLPARAENVARRVDEIPGWGSVHPRWRLSALERRAGHPVSVPGVPSPRQLYQSWR